MVADSVADRGFGLSFGDSGGFPGSGEEWIKLFGLAFGSAVKVVF